MQDICYSWGSSFPMRSSWEHTRAITATLRFLAKARFWCGKRTGTRIQFPEFVSKGPQAGKILGRSIKVGGHLAANSSIHNSVALYKLKHNSKVGGQLAHAPEHSPIPIFLEN